MLLVLEHPELPLHNNPAELRDKSRCCYCLTSEANSSIPMTHDYIHPVSKGGETTGRTTIVKLRINNPVILIARKLWVISGWHPPLD